MQRVTKVKDKRDKTSERPIKVGDLITAKSNANDGVLLVVSEIDSNTVGVLRLRSAYGVIVKKPNRFKLTTDYYEHYRGKVTIEQE